MWSTLLVALLVAPGVEPAAPARLTVGGPGPGDHVRRITVDGRCFMIHES